MHFILFCALFGRKWKQHSHEEGLGIKPVIWLSTIKTQEKRSNDLWIHHVIWSWKVCSRGTTLFSRSIWSWFIYMGAPMLLLLQVIGFGTMLLWLSNRFDLETHQKVNICIFTYKFVFCTRWAHFFKFFIYYLSNFWSWISKERWTWVIVVVSFLVACVMAKGEVPVVKSVGGLNDNFLDVITNIVGRFSNFESFILSLAMQ